MAGKGSARRPLSKYITETELTRNYKIAGINPSRYDNEEQEEELLEYPTCSSRCPECES
jgi:hypothetical protein